LAVTSAVDIEARTDSLSVRERGLAAKYAVLVYPSALAAAGPASVSITAWKADYYRTPRRPPRWPMCRLSRSRARSASRPRCLWKTLVLSLLRGSHQGLPHGHLCGAGSDTSVRGGFTTFLW